MIENKETFFSRLKSRLTPSEMVAVQGAYYLAKYGHRAQVRKESDAEGNPLRYFEHVRRVALILMDEARIHDPELIITCLLHDAIEDTDDLSPAVIEQFFGVGVARRVLNLTKHPGEPKDAYYARLQEADPLTVICKMCDRLDNLRSLGSTGPDFQAKQARETENHYLDIFARALAQLPPLQERHLRGSIFQEVIDLVQRYRSYE